MDSNGPLPAAADQVFVGGSGRSGTTVVGRLLGRHSRLACLPYELKVQTVLPRVLRGRMSVEEFAATSHRVHRRARDPATYELPLDPALEVLGATLHTDGPRAGGRFVRALLDPFATAERKPGWVEMTPANLTCAGDLAEILPESRFVHVLRDGRDVATSVSAVWGQMAVSDALEWWAKRIRGIDAQVRRLPEHRTTTILLEELVRDHRDETYEALLAYLNLEDESQVRGFFDETVTADRAHLGRWRDLEPRDRRDLCRQYDRLLAEMSESEATCAPLLNSSRRLELAR